MLQLLVLGLVQGLTEFLPVSSSGHLVAVPFLLGWELPTVAFDVAVHLGTALAVIVYFRRDLAAMLRGVLRRARGSGDQADRRAARLALLLAAASVPAGVAGIAFGGFFEGLFDDPQIAAVFLAVSGLILLAAEWLRSRRAEARPLEEISVGDALTMGLAQAFAITPGLSRSGTTIAAGLGRGLSREASARFSFLLGLPAFLGAALIELPDLEAGTALGGVMAASLVAALVGFAAIAFLIRYLRTQSLRPFATYLFVAAAVVLGYWLQVK